MMRIPTVVGLLSLFLLGCAAPAPDPIAAVAPADPPAVRTAECRWTTAPIALDGKLDEPAWAKSQVLQDFSVFWQKRKPQTATKARLLWDDRYLYFAAEMEDHDVYADVKEANGMTWNNDVFELFFKPAADQLRYYEFQVNALNTPLELYLPSRGAGGYGRFKDGGKQGLESVVKIDGTINNTADRDKGWIVEGRVPWTAFLTSGGKPKAGAKWRFALCRYDYSATLERPDLSSSAPLTQPDFHRYEDYGELTFVGK